MVFPRCAKADILLRPIASSTVSPCYALAGFLHKLLSPLPRKSESYVKNSGHFGQLLKLGNLQSLGTEISSIMMIHGGTVCLAGQRHHGKLEVCLGTTYFQVDDKSFNRKMAWL
jgi:hypothetical protein